MKKKAIAVLILILIAISAGTGWFWCLSGHQAINRNNYIRLHIIANSNNPLDQALKYMVRDEVVRIMTPYLSGVKNKEQARKIVLEHQGDIKEVAGRVIAGQGYAYPVAVCMGNYQFPDRTYHIKSGGELTLPAGEYEAVRVIIGQGRGANWWCVLFPPLCFVNPASITGNTADRAGQVGGTEKEPHTGQGDATRPDSGAETGSKVSALSAAASDCYIPQDLELPANAPAGAPKEMQRVEFRFKLVELYQDSRHWFNKFFK